MTQRINVTVSDILNKKMDAYAERYGISKSALAGFVIGQWMDSMERVNDSVYGSNGNQGLLQRAFEQLSIDDIEKDK